MYATDDRDEDLRRRAGRVPVRLQRSIDRFRVARGMTPLWAGQASGRPSGPKGRQGRPGTRA
jgi:hypothetical protein